MALDDFGIEVLRRHWRFVTDRSELVERPARRGPLCALVPGARRDASEPRHADTRPREPLRCGRGEGSGAAAKRGEKVEPYGFHFHELRHFSVTTLLAAGVDIRTVAERHGHAQATMTLNRYAHALPERGPRRCRRAGSGSERLGRIGEPSRRLAPCSPPLLRSVSGPGFSLVGQLQISLLLATGAQRLPPN